MSTHIEHGYRVAGPGGTAPDWFDLTQVLREGLEPLREAAYVGLLARAAAAVLDAEAVPAAAPDPDPPAPRTRPAVWVAAEELAEAARENDHRNEQDLSFTVVLLRDPQHRTGPGHALVYTGRAEYTTAWESLPGVGEYAYWNHTDRPAHLSEEAWEERRATWDRVLGRDAPARRGLTWELPGTGDRLSSWSIAREAVQAALPDRLARATTLARARVPVIEPAGERWRFRSLREVADEVTAEAARLEPLLPELDLDALYARPAP